MKHFYKAIRFNKLQDMDKWLESWKRKVLEFLGLFKWTVFSPVMLGCMLFPYNIDLDYIDKKHPCNLQDIARELLKNRSRKVRVREGVEGFLEGIEITQEDYYWYVVTSRGEPHFITCCSPLDFVDVR